MSDDTTPPFACSEPFPLNAGDRIAALERKSDELAAEVMAYRAMLLEARRCWVADGTDLANRIDAKVGTQPRAVAAWQYGGGQ